MWGLSSVLAIAGSLARGQSLTTLELTEMPNQPFSYWLAIVSAVLKPRWSNAKTWPSLKVSVTAPATMDVGRLARFCKLAGWPAPPAAGSPVPGMFLMVESFKLVLQVMTLPAFPVSVLGTVVNKRGRYAYLRPVAASERLTYSCALDPRLRPTFSGHTEFDLLLQAVSHDKGDVVWQAVLSLVLLQPKGKGKPKAGGSAAKLADADGGAGEQQPLDTWYLPENTGRAYASLDGDVSPMHLYRATAVLMGFPAPVANVHLLAARAEASLAAKHGSGAPIVPLGLELEFKKPVLLPAQLTVTGAGSWAAAAAGGGVQLHMSDTRGKPVAIGKASSKPTRAVLG